MAYDRKLLSAARRELERDREAHEDELEARRRDIYAREPRIRAIDRELSATAIQVLRAALEQGSDPEKAIASLRERNLSLQEERSRLLRGLGLPADWLTNRPMCEKCGDTGYEGAATCECVKRRYARLLKQQLSSVLPIEDQNFEKFNLSYYSPRIDPNMHDSPLENIKVNLFECKAYARNFGENSPICCCTARPDSARPFSPPVWRRRSRRAAFRSPTTQPSTSLPPTRPSSSATATARRRRSRAARYERADLLIIDDMGTEMGTAFTVSALYNLINNRLMAHRPMIVNTNLLPDELKKRYSPAVASRLLGEFKQLRFFGDDIRMLKSRMQNR